MNMSEIAAARAAAVEQRSHRPQQRRASDLAAPSRVPHVAFRSSLLLRDEPATDVDGKGLLRFEGYATVYEAPYEMYDMFGAYFEVVTAGAASESLNRADLDVPLVLGHDQMRRIARTTNGSLLLTEDEHGLRVTADLDPDDDDVRYIAPKLRAGLIDEMSFAFRITQGVWSPDYSEYRIDRFDIHRGDVAIVGFGANPATESGLRSQDVSRLRLRLAVAAAL